MTHKIKLSFIISVLITIGIMTCKTNGQSIQMERPAEWENLIYGGRFMDRFLPMPEMGKLTTETWGAEGVVPRYVDNGIEDNQWSYWGGNVKTDEDGKYHLFVCRWREDSPKGHMEWPRSQVAHAVAEYSFGPYRVQGTVGPGHNPEIFRLADGRYVIYVMRGYYLSEELNGPWEYNTFEFAERDRQIIEGLSNLTFAQREDGSYLMVCRGGGVWFSKTGISPYHQVTDKSVYPPVEGRFEDPVIWRTNIQYHLIVNDWYGRIAYYLRSKDGIYWKVEPGEAYLPGIARYEDGTVVDWYKYERIKVLQDKHGRATQAHFAVIDTIKWNDLGNDNHSSKQIVVPLTTGRLITILNKEQITPGTKTIRIKIEAEEGLIPYTDIDLESLRFGASEEVNFGRGSEVIKSEKLGDDLIVTFSGKGNGLTEKNFAGKLVGKTKKGELLFGYARLPWLEYLESSLSARVPVFTQIADGFRCSVEIQNFGQVPSKPSQLVISFYQGGTDIEIATGVVPSLNSFEKTTLELTCGDIFRKGASYRIKVMINSKNRTIESLQREMIPVD